MNRAAIIAITVFASVAVAAAQTPSPSKTPPKVLYDSGDSRPISELFGGPAPTPPPETPPPNLNGVFPVETPSMGLGRFQSAPWPGDSRWRGQPMFLIGADKHSLAWLKAKRGRLKDLGAAGLLVDAPSEASLMAARRIAPDLQIIAASTEDIANHTGLRLYPVLITRDGIEQ